MPSPAASHAVEETITIVLADDHHVVRAGLRLLLEVEDGFAVVTEAADADAALRSVLGQKPTVLVLDLNMPGDMSPLEAIPLVRVCADRTWSSPAPGEVGPPPASTPAVMPAHDPHGVADDVRTHGGHEERGGSDQSERDGGDLGVHDDSSGRVRRRSRGAIDGAHIAGEQSSRHPRGSPVAGSANYG